MARTDGLSYISATLKGAAQMMNDKDRAMALDCYEHWHRECERIGGSGPAVNVAFTIHEIIDEHVAHMRATSKHGPDITCRSGCAGCCHLHVDIYPHEAALLLLTARERGIEIDTARLARQAGRTSDTWQELPLEDRRCVFLAHDQTCSVYEHRPGSCRKYLVKSDPERCDTTKYPGGEVAVVFDVQAEIVHSAAMTVYQAGSMAERLMEALRDEPR